MYLEIAWKKIWPYEAIKYSNWEVKWDILPLLYDNAIINLSWDNKKFTLCYKKSKSLFWKEMIYADLVDEETAETFSFQVSNIYILKILKNDINMIAKVWKELKYFSDFWRKEMNVESDWDKSELTPLWYYETFISYDDNYFYPIYFDWLSHNTWVTKFYDYYGYKSFIDEDWKRHIYMLIEHNTSSETNPIWYFVDNFQIISEKLYFDDYVENWTVDEDWDIVMETTSLKKYYIEVWKSNKIVLWNKPVKEKTNNIKSFLFTRFYEDTDSEYIVWKNDNWYFILSNKTKSLSFEDQKLIEYFDKFISFNKEYNLFIMKNKSGEIVFLDIYWVLFTTTDLVDTNIIEQIKISDDKKVLSINVVWEPKSREYIL